MIKKTYILQGNEFSLEILFKKKKNISIKIGIDRNILVTAPEFLSQEEVIRIVSTKEKWIINKFKEIRASDIMKNDFRYENGENFWYLGEKYILDINIDESVKSTYIVINKNKLILKTNTNSKALIKLSLQNWYRERALEVIGERTTYYSKITGLVPSKIIVKDQKSRWGSCNSKKEIRFNWRLIMVPLDVIEYVIIHELCHIKHMNHSKEYWDLVSKYMINHKEKRKWLKENAIRLMHFM